MKINKLALKEAFFNQPKKKKCVRGGSKDQKELQLLGSVLFFKTFRTRRGVLCSVADLQRCVCLLTTGSCRGLAVRKRQVPAEPALVLLPPLEEVKEDQGRRSSSAYAAS